MILISNFFPSQLVGPTIDSNCDTNVICSIFVNNSGVPLVSAFGEFFMENGGTFVPEMENLNSSDPCLSYLLLPMVDIVFDGSWNASAIVGAWNGEFNLVSNTPPPVIELFHFVMAGSGQQIVRGMLRVTTESQVSYNTTFCCGFGCDPTTTSIESTTIGTTTTNTVSTTTATMSLSTTVSSTIGTTVESTTDSTIQSTTASTSTASPTTTPIPPISFVTLGPVLNLNCPNRLICTIFANNSFAPIVSVTGNFTIESGVLVEAFPVFSDPNICVSSVSLPTVSPLVFSGLWDETSLRGTWNGPSNTPSQVKQILLDVSSSFPLKKTPPFLKIPPPLTQLVSFAVDGGDRKAVRGRISVVAESGLVFFADLCCGQCEPIPPNPCPENATVLFQKYSCRQDEVSA